MSAFLWVEDFDGNFNLNWKNLTARVFKLSDDSPIFSFKHEGQFKNYLEKRNIFLKNSLEEALDFIHKRENRDIVDYIILDIDLGIYARGNNSNNEHLEKIIRDWYGEFEGNIKKLAELKKIAGYHLWTQLVTDYGFPRDRIQFYSKHGAHLNNIKVSFSNAKIEPPVVFEKKDIESPWKKESDGDITSWVAERSEQSCTSEHSYTFLRRNVIDYCLLITNQLEAQKLTSKGNRSPSMLRLSKLPGRKTKFFTLDSALEMLKMLPLYLPQIITGNNQKAILRAFIRAFSMEWDRFNPNFSSTHTLEVANKNSFNKNKPIKSAASVLKLLRNTFSHGSNPINVDCNQTAQFFILNMRVIFEIKQTDELNAIEKKLLPKLKIYDDDKSHFDKDAESHMENLQKFKPTIESLNYTGETDLHKKLCDLQKRADPDFYIQAPEFLLNLLWHQLISEYTDKDEFYREFKSIYLMMTRFTELP